MNFVDGDFDFKAMFSNYLAGIVLEFSCWNMTCNLFISGHLDSCAQN